VRRLVEEGENKAREVLSENLDQLHRLATALLEFETLNGEESKRIIAGNDIGRDDPKDRSPRALSVGGSSIPKSRRPGGWGEPTPAGV
jgi:cell division protease FtsH